MLLHDELWGDCKGVVIMFACPKACSFPLQSSNPGTKVACTSVPHSSACSLVSVLREIAEFEVAVVACQDGPLPAEPSWNEF